MRASQIMPNFQSSVWLKYVKHSFQYLVNHFLTFLLVPIMAASAVELLRMGPKEILRLCDSPHLGLVHILCSSLFIVFMATLYFISKPYPIYLVDYTCYKPPGTYRVPRSFFLEHLKLSPSFDPESVKFQFRILERSGLGERTCVPPALHYIAPDPTMADARAEAELVIFSAMDALFERTGIKPQDVDFLIVNCSMFSPTPSLSDMVINKYKMRSNIKSFNLSGMGCSPSPISVNIARDLLQVHANAYAVVVSTEIVTPNWYTGNQRSMLLPNCLFRMGAATLLLSNRRRESRRAKYRLMHVVRTHRGADDRAYHCVFQEEDVQRNVGISLSKDLMGIAAFEHFCIHAGGRAVIDELEKNLQLSPEHVEASRMTLHRFGNTSSSSLWYEMNYIEAKGRMKKGDRSWQIGFGSGFKCNSLVWKCNRSIKAEADGPWADCIDQYPVHTVEAVKLQQ
ncbi:3-ketoacyl-CoA synthase 6 isoform X2 [Amborella trichopoda]|uniref:3-ketoacyl-CoA synthase 6 isoform X2 n=1 Tax=Amborella trichopoda TaxID=13333 RepID=UPI0009BEC513|nr:3-ketoacyl-CoA synthase 6 isoform X2 [Amborella trichopoda]|eukprot:XP_020521585.1 3-ketoacyl-CoA synthase 6 isoform X2 [Amborella trichopoda]